MQFLLESMILDLSGQTKKLLVIDEISMLDSSIIEHDRLQNFYLQLSNMCTSKTLDIICISNSSNFIVKLKNDRVSDERFKFSSIDHSLTKVERQNAFANMFNSKYLNQS